MFSPSWTSRATEKNRTNAFVLVREGEREGERKAVLECKCRGWTVNMYENGCVCFSI